ncbi:LuxR family transcriptional regulator [Pseudomonas endophytica]|uniref:LuxR family transcriptional regulator n=1 Tax=Pseudomonas endophytica TaxID=1563157 RepID=A0A0Q0X7C6_9PSED|nr:response regulator [Pseudomonas endophytica]KQB52952.1 LuxR family transcriptional regulator [Pseudomonas endophytica]
MIRLGNATISLERREAFLDGQPMRIGGRAFEILATLIRAKGRIVEKDDLINQVWPGTVVEENNLQVQISTLRKTFGTQAVIQTVPRRGYRLAAEIGTDETSAPRNEIVLPTETNAPIDASGVRVFIIDDDPSVTGALSRLLRAEDIPHTLFGSAEEFLSAQWESPYACILLDINLPDKSGLDLQASLMKIKSPWPIIFMTGNGTIQMTVQAMKAGAKEFLTKPFNDDHLLEALAAARHKAVESGKAWIYMKMAIEKYARLTNREKEVYSWVVNGLTHKEISKKIGTSEVTTKVHKKNIMLKMQSRSIIELVSMYNTIKLNRHPEDQEPA